VPIYFISGYWFGGYGVYLKLNYHILLIAISGTILLMIIGGYFINEY